MGRFYAFITIKKMSQYFENDTSIKSKTYIVKAKFNDVNFELESNNGVFSKDSLDFGSELLINTTLKLDRKGTNLDLGCGIGVIGLVLSYFDKNKYVLSDVNLTALTLAKKNADKLAVSSRVKVIESDCFSNLTRYKFANIYLNPPIRAGKKVTYRMYDESYKYLKDGGNLYVVIRIKQGAITTYKYLENLFGYSNVSIINRKKGYQIILAHKKVKK